MEKDLTKLRHSAAHVLAQAVLELFPDTKLAIGPPIENGFYYDFDRKGGFNDFDLKKIEKKASEIIKKNFKIEKVLKTREEAKKVLKNQPYKLELLNDLKDKQITFYKQGDFIDLCKGPHVKSIGEIKAFKILNTAGAYWKGDSKNKMLQRIYATAFYDRKDLRSYIYSLEEAKKRDHRKIGEKLDLFMFHEYTPGSPFFLPKGTFIYNKLVDLMKNEYNKRGYKEVRGPNIYDSRLWKTSGHWEHFREDMFTLKVDKRDFAIKPMNCPGHMLIYKSRLRSYRDLPLRFADFSTLHRNELKGVLGGLFRVRALSQDDAHIFLTEEQLEKEIGNVLDFVDYIYKKVFKFKYSVHLSTKPEKAIGDGKLWNKAEKTLKLVLDKKKIKYEIKKGEGAFYGPKVDFDVKDSLGRSWQLATIQLDFQMPLNFGLTYESKSGKKETPIVIHRAILGSLERFIGVLLEHYSGNLPLWLSPIQVVVLTVTDKHLKFASTIVEELKKENIQVELDNKNGTISKKVRNATSQKIPYIVTLGDKEIKSKKLAIRTRDGKVKFNVSVKKFIKDLKLEIEKKC